LLAFLHLSDIESDWCIVHDWLAGFSFLVLAWHRRSSAYSRILFELAEVEVLFEEKQKEFPADLNPINMFALVAKGSY
jgi:hypothetical protein